MKEFNCYEIWRPNIPADGCKTQCKECAEESKNRLIAPVKEEKPFEPFIPCTPSEKKKNFNRLIEKIQKPIRDNEGKVIGWEDRPKRKPVPSEQEKQEELTFTEYLRLIGADETHAAAVTIWKTLKGHNYRITRK